MSAHPSSFERRLPGGVHDCRQGSAACSTWRLVLALCFTFLVTSAASAQVLTSISGGTVTGGQPATVTIRVSLSTLTGTPGRYFSHDLAAAPFSDVPFTIPALALSTTVVVPTKPVAVDTIVPISAVQSNRSNVVVTGRLTILAPRITGIAIAPTNITGGIQAIGTLSLGAAAPAGGLRVLLESDNPNVLGVPSEVHVLPGQNSANFPLISSSVDVDTTVNVSANIALQGPFAVPVLVQAPSLDDLALGLPGGDSVNTSLTVVGGQEVVGKVEITGPAGLGGHVVHLESSDPQLVSVPPSVTVASGALSASFPILTFGTAAAQTVTVRGSAAGVIRDADLGLTPSSLIELSFSPAMVVGGRQTRGRVALNGKAPTGGATVQLDSLVPDLAEVPAQVVIPAGAATALFDVNTARVTQDSDIPVNATRGGVSISTAVHLTAADLGDADGDGDVDEADYRRFLDCFEQFGVSRSCDAIFGFAASAGIDLADAAGFQNAFTGQAVTAPPPRVVVDPGVQPFIDQLPPLQPGQPPRPLAAMTDHTGVVAEFVENEMAVILNTPAALQQFLARWNGTVLQSAALPFPAPAGATFYLIRVDASLANTSNLEKDVLALKPDGGGTVRLSSEAGRKVMAAAVSELKLGNEAALNWILKPQGFPDRRTRDNATGPSGWNPNAYCWDYMQAGSTQDIGVTEAWRALDLHNRMGNTVEIFIIDGGFQTSAASPNPDFPPTTIIPDPNFDARTVTNPINCGGGNPCPYHGNNVLSACMGIPNNDVDVAGPAGPIGRARIFVSPEAFGGFGIGDFASAIMNIIANLAFGETKIYNWSAGTRIPDFAGLLSDTFSKILNFIADNDVLLFASAGNEGQNVDAENCVNICGCVPFCCVCCADVCYEEAVWVPCELSGVICVGGLAPDARNRDGDSNYGTDGSVDIFAPYRVWVGPDPETPSVHAVNGTSFSSPYAAGVAALIWAADPSLSSNAVRNLLISTAHDSPDNEVSRYVHAQRAVVEALGNNPPDLCILSPVNNCTTGCPPGGTGPARAAGNVFSRGIPLSFFARVTDVETPSLNVVWTSNLDGPIGSGTSMVTSSLRLGTHVITAATTDSSGVSVADQIVIEIINDPPIVTLVEPLNNSTYCVGEFIPLRAFSFDINNLLTTGGQLPNAAMVWTSNIQGTIGAGHETVTLLITPGTHVISLTGTDELGAQDVETVSVIIQAQPCDPIAVAIVNPASDATFFANGTDPQGRAFLDIAVEALAFDAEDGLLDGDSVQWFTNRTDLQPAFLGNGRAPTIRLFWHECDESDTAHSVTVQVRDSEGNLRTRVRSIVVRVIC
ncbi:MAG: S8/S53 family peptidase [Planctomycetes bacterium]|nr:S8/S53 family peptidase [Planctomycetota bacterium]